MRKFTIFLCAILISIIGYSKGQKTSNQLNSSKNISESGKFNLKDLKLLNIESNNFQNYCTPYGTDPTRHINNFKTIGGIQNIENLDSGFSTNGYGDFYLSQTIEQVIGGMVSFESYVAPEGGLKIWVDWNQDGAFDTNEVVWHSQNSSSNKTGSFIVPEHALLGETRMRIGSSWLEINGPDTACKTLFIYGEFEDYKFIVSEENDSAVENPCENTIVMECGIEYTADLIPNSGYWNNYTGNPANYSGSEQVFKFTADTTGSYLFVLNQGAADADFFAMDSCSNTANNLGGGYWDGINNEILNLEAGQTIYLIADLYAPHPTTVSIEVQCPAEPIYCEAVDVPYLMDFETAIAPDLPECTTTENVGSGNNWTIVSGPTNGFIGNYLRYGWSTSSPANTWFYTHGINLEAGETYKISYDYGADLPTYTESLKVAYGTSAESTAMTTILADHPSINHNYPVTNEVIFTPDESGVYYFGFHAYSATNQFYLNLDNIEIVVHEETTDPDPIQYCEPELDCEDGDMITNVTFQEINNDSSCSINGYANYTDMVAYVNAGAHYPISVTVGDGNFVESVSVWIDFNNNGEFEESEFFFIGSGSDEVITNIISIPLDLNEGNYRMRVRVAAVGQFFATPDMACDEDQFFGETEDYTINVSQALTDPESPCDDIIIMECGIEYSATLVPYSGYWLNYTGVSWNYSGSEQVWEFTAPYTGEFTFTVNEGENDADFFLMDACSNTANNVINDYWTGNYQNQYIATLNEGETYYLIADLFSTNATTVTVKVSCNDEQEPIDENFYCEDNFVTSNEIEDGSFFGGDNNERLAVDIIVGDEGFSVYGMELNIFTNGNTDLDFNFTIYEDNEGLPGSIFNENISGTVHSSEYVGNLFFYDIYKYVVTFDAAIALEANSTYWIEVQTNGLAWERTTADTFGAQAAYMNDNTLEEWVIDTNEMVYSLICEDLSVSDLSSFDFAYYPNPVRDILNITSQKTVQSVEVYNLTGQKVMVENKVNQDQIDVSKLAAGTYVFRVTLDNGQVETFKIIKK